mgnify:FL=1
MGRLTQDEVNSLYKMLYILDRLFEKYNIKYVLMSGSLLGAMRNLVNSKGQIPGSMIPGDDDIDLGVSDTDEHKLQYVKQDLAKYDYVLKKTDPLGRVIYKVFETDGQKVCKDLKLFNYCMKFKFPFVDIFILRNTNGRVTFRDPINKLMYGKEWFSIDELLPIRRAKFGPLEVSVPNNPIPYLIRTYGPDCFVKKRSTFDHKNLKIQLSESEATYEHEIPSIDVTEFYKQI